MAHYHLSSDSEYVPVLDRPTKPMTISLWFSDRDKAPKMWFHPNAPIPLEKRKHPTFKTPFAVMDQLGCEWRENDGTLSTEMVFCVNDFFFFAFKDIEWLFADRQFYIDKVLPYLERTRRISSQRPITLPWDVKLPNKKGKLVWHKLTLKPLDICAMQGNGSLAEYASNVGFEMPDKATYTREEKGRMDEMYLLDPDKYEAYANGDVVNHMLYQLTNELYNKVAAIMCLEPRDVWGMSTGKVVATMLSSWIAKQLGIDLRNLAVLTQCAGSKGIVTGSHFVKNKKLLYTAMVDGGRAVKEVDVDATVEGVLVDTDIDGCYGNGLRNQLFAVGNPTIIDQPLTWEEFEKKFGKQLVPGLWYARVSWKQSPPSDPKKAVKWEPFNQDLLISKVEQSFTNWDNAQQAFEAEVSTANYEDGERVYDASMVLLTQAPHQASLNHDLLQALQSCASSKEWGWLKKNMIVESALVYEAKNRVDKVTTKMGRGMRFSSNVDIIVEGSREWVCLDLKDYIVPLLEERKKHDKKTPMNKFLKLIINTTYGVIASEFFSEEGTGCSNVVVGNNITARARTMAWCMAKGFGGHMSVTDGGVFDINKVAFFRKMSLHLLEGMHRGIYVDGSGHKFVDYKPLMGREVTAEELSLMTHKEHQAFLNEAQLQHLKSQFGELDIFKYNQYALDIKHWYTKLTLHSKVDYRLVHPSCTYLTPEQLAKKKRDDVDPDDSVTIALRGLPKKPTIDGIRSNDLANQLFDAIEAGTPIKVEGTWTQQLSLSDYRESYVKKPGNELIPGDTISDTKRCYSHTPLKARYIDMSHYKRVLRDYEAAKATGDPNEVANVKTEV